MTLIRDYLADFADAWSHGVEPNVDGAYESILDSFGVRGLVLHVNELHRELDDLNGHSCPIVRALASHRVATEPSTPHDSAPLDTPPRA